MKKIILLMVVAALLYIGNSRVNAQVVSINVNLLPQWGLVEYDYVEYYYLPEYDIYYYAPGQQFVYRKGNKWHYANSLPYQYRHIDLYQTYKVVINEPKPYLRNDYYASHYKEYKHSRSKQSLIRDSKDLKYKSHNNRSDNSGFNKQVKSNQKSREPSSRENENQSVKNKSKGNKKR